MFINTLQSGKIGPGTGDIDWDYIVKNFLDKLRYADLEECYDLRLGWGLAWPMDASRDGKVDRQREISVMTWIVNNSSRLPVGLSCIVKEGLPMWWLEDDFSNLIITTRGRFKYWYRGHVFKVFSFFEPFFSLFSFKIYNKVLRAPIFFFSNVKNADSKTIAKGAKILT